MGNIEDNIVGHYGETNVDMNIVSFSGGKDSTAMLLMMIEKGIPIGRVICVDTTKEFPQMYEHIKKVQAIIETVKIDFDYYFSEHKVKTRNGSKNDVGYGWPSFLNRWCTTFKTQLSKKLLKGCNNYIKYVGIAIDEKHRVGRNTIGENIRYPLVEWQITEKQALDYCYSKGLDWGGLYEKFHRVSCWCCPMSRIGELRVLYNEFPELWKELEEMDKKSFRMFKCDYSVKDLSEKFINEQTKAAQTGKGE
jgi:3'-phosphoadenosine 5'-phosphosulfate sulfotransferase (PAPS reductase)/FAD synthetase